ncbi:Ger(x)C family spore germination protein [Paenibacillus sp. M1]|uniref:Ger(X)C family spore germination protein n=1 Tax=Paenibacillus haidiansis TaxID=1574488 RepID=A0ABU7VT79_9BACL
MRNRSLKSVLLGLLLAGSCMLLSGCWDSLGIEDRALVLSLAVDEAPPESNKQEEKVTHIDEKPPGKMIRITAQIAVPGQVPLGPSSASSGERTQNSVWIVQVVGHSLDDALNNLQQQISDPKYLIHLRVVVISEAIAREGLDDLNDYLRRNAEVRRRTWLLVSDIPAEKVLAVAPPLERVPTLYLLSMIEKSVRSGKFPLDYLGIFWTSESKWGQDGYLPYISIRGQDKILVKGLAYFSGGRLVGTTRPLEIGAYMAAKGMDPGGYSSLLNVSGLGYVMVQTQERHTNIKVDIVEGKPRVKLKILLEGSITEQFDSSVDINSPEAVGQVERKFNEEGIKAVKSLFRDTQLKHSDIFGIGEIVRAHHKDFWKKHVHEKKDWGNIYSGIPVDVSVHMTIRRIGLKQ